MNIDDLIATAQPRTEVVRVCARGDLVAAHAKAVAALAELLSAADDDSLAGNPDVAAAAEAVKAIEAEQDEYTFEIVVSSVSRNRWANLLAEHPPTKEQRRAGHFADPATFAIAVVAECVDDLDPAKAAKLADVLPISEWGKLESAALILNATETPSPKLQAVTDLLQANGHSSTTPPPEASREADSLAGSGVQ